MARLLALAVSSLLLCGCTYSVHPLLEKDDYTESLDLSGTWEMERSFRGKKERHQLTIEPFSSDDKSSYDLVINGDDYVANVGKIGHDTFLQMTMLDHPIDSPPVLDSIPVYWFARIEKDGDAIRLYPTNDEWCEKNLGKLNAPHVKHPSSDQPDRPFFAFTMQTEDLQKFVTTHRDKLFSGMPMTWRPVGQTSADVADSSEKFANVNGIRMFYRCYGAGPPLLLLHGFFENGDAVWNPVVARLSKHYRLIIPDLRGHGRTTNPSREFRFEQSADDILALLDHLEIPSCYAVGHSGGGMTLLHVALRQPKRLTAMVLDGAPHSFSAEMRNEISKTVGQIKGGGNFYAEVTPLHDRGKDQVDELLDQFLEFSRSTGMRLTSEDLNSITVRTLVMLGDRDEFFPVVAAIEMVREIPNSSLSVLPNRGHTITNREALRIAEIAQEFFSRVDVN